MGFQLPQIIYVSGSMWHKSDRDIIEVRPLTATALVRGVGGNFVKATYWRFMLCLRLWGFLKTPELGVLRWTDASLCFWRYWMPGRTCPARLTRAIKRRL